MGYLRHVFAELPKTTTLAEIEALLPWNVKSTRSLDDATLTKDHATAKLSGRQSAVF